MAEYFLFNNDPATAFVGAVSSKVRNAITYTPTIITTSNVEINKSFVKSSVTINMLKTNAFASNLLKNNQEAPIKVDIFKDAELYWSGWVNEITPSGINIQLICNTFSTKLRRSGTQKRITLHCRHTIYSEACGVNKPDFETIYNVTDAGLDTFFVTTGKANNYFAGGIATFNGQTRYIVSNTATQIVLESPFEGDTGTGDLICAPNCPMTLSGCRGFDNVLNFGGFNRIPVKNPFTSIGAL